MTNHANHTDFLVVLMNSRASLKSMNMCIGFGEAGEELGGYGVVLDSEGSVARFH